MEQFTIEIETRTDFGSRVSRGLRREGKLPAVVYSHGKDAFPVVLSAKEFVHLAEKARPSQVFTFKSGNAEIDGQLALVKDVQLDPVKDTVLHVDFQLLQAGEEVKLRVPVLTRGEAPGVKIQGGILTLHARELELFCFPSKIPAEIVVDVSSLNLGDRIQASDLQLPEGVRLAGSPDETIANIISGRAARLAEATAAEAEQKEGAGKK